MISADATRPRTMVCVRIRGASAPVADALSELNACRTLHHVDWKVCRPSRDGRCQYVRFLAPDAETVRLLLRHAGLEWDSIAAARTESRGGNSYIMPSTCACILSDATRMRPDDVTVAGICHNPCR